MRLTDEQRKRICELLHDALMDISNLGEAGKSKQAGDLAYAFHNLSNDMWEDFYSLEQFRDLFLVPYLQKYPEGQIRDYVKVLNEVLKMGEDPAGN